MELVIYKYLKLLPKHTKYYKGDRWTKLTEEGYGQQLEYISESEWVYIFGSFVLYYMGSSWLRWNSLSANNFAFLFSFLLFDEVSLESSQESVSASALSDVFVSYVNSFNDNSVSDSLVDFNTDTSWAYGEDLASLSVIALVWHTSVDGTVGDDVY